jgi:hypothetical protein
MPLPPTAVKEQCQALIKDDEWGATEIVLIQVRAVRFRSLFDRLLAERKEGIVDANH